jgi:hypothetical protein
VKCLAFTQSAKELHRISFVLLLLPAGHRLTGQGYVD